MKISFNDILMQHSVQYIISPFIEAVGMYFCTTSNVGSSDFFFNCCLFSKTLKYHIFALIRDSNFFGLPGAFTCDTTVMTLLVSAVCDSLSFSWRGR